jgi:hypothetical protein
MRPYSTSHPEFKLAPAAPSGGCEGCEFTARPGCFEYSCNGTSLPFGHPLQGMGPLIWVAKDPQ